jgi:hypothetical protein
MPLFTINFDGKALVPVLMRIADALDRIAPLPDEPAADLKPEDAVQYVNEEAMDRAEALREMGEEAKALSDYAAAHPEEFPEVQR